MSTTESHSSAEGTTLADVELKLEVVVIPVSDVDRAKAFYADRLQWRLDADFAGDDGFRIVQLTSPGSPCSIQFGSEYPAEFGSIVDVSGELAPRNGTVQQTIDRGFARSAVRAGALFGAAVAPAEAHLEDGFQSAVSYLPNKADWFEGRWAGLGRPDEPVLGRRNTPTAAGQSRCHRMSGQPSCCGRFSNADMAGSVR